MVCVNSRSPGELALAVALGPTCAVTRAQARCSLKVIPSYLEIVNFALFSWMCQMLVINREQMWLRWICGTTVLQKLGEELLRRRDFTSCGSDSPYDQAEQEIGEGENLDLV